MAIDVGAGMKRVHMWIRAVGASAVLVLAVSGTTGCRGSTTAASSPGNTAASAGTGASSGVTTAIAPAAATGGPSADASPVLVDGRSAVYLTGLDTTHQTVTFDLIEFLTGEAAKAQWKKEHPQNPDGPDNDYMIVNNNALSRTLPVASDVPCVVLSTLSGTDTKTISFGAFPACLKHQNTGMTLTTPDIAVLPFWLTVQHGKVIRFEEQFLP
jgi:hypothetical protein